ncbi:MAG: TrmH family RNA methyltransferase, partial [Anaerolineae bacterium]
MHQQITSLQNKHIKNVVKLRQRHHRDAQQLMLVEGVRESRRALESRLIPSMAFICPPLLNGEGEQATAVLRNLSQNQNIPTLEVTPVVYAKIAVRGESGGLLLTLPYLQRSLADLAGASFLVIIEGDEKPGNLGAILRTADAAGVDGVIIAEGDTGGTDVNNPNVVRASLGALFTLPV